MDHQWYYVRDGKSLGPISISELRQLVARHELGPDDLVWREGMAEWSSVASISITPPGAAPPPVPAPRPASSSHKQRPRRSGTPANQQVIVWSMVGVVAVFLCIGWVIMSRPSMPSKPERAAIPSELVTHPNGPSEPAMKPPESVSASRPIDDSDRELRSPDPVDTPSGLVVPQQRPREISKPPVETQNPEVTVDERPNATPASVQPVAVPPKQTLFQVVEIRRIPTFSIQGLETKQSLHYQVLSRLELERNIESSTTKVAQFVEDTRLVAADDSSRASFAKALDGLKRQQYSYLLNDRGEVIEFTGNKDTRMTIPLDLTSSTGFQLTSVIDEDGWKELAELTFVVPPGKQQAGEPWRRQMTHDWGALGSWAGITTFAPQLAREQLVPIAFTREMVYTAPGSDAGGLPFQIRDASFVLQQASGTIAFDVAAQRVRNATEIFDVRGTVSVELAGVSVQIEMTEQQRIEIRLSEQRLALQ